MTKSTAECLLWLDGVVSPKGEPMDSIMTCSIRAQLKAAKEMGRALQKYFPFEGAFNSAAEEDMREALGKWKSAGGSQ